jgi:hypothetical protein
VEQLSSVSLEIGEDEKDVNEFRHCQVCEHPSVLQRVSDRESRCTISVTHLLWFEAEFVGQIEQRGSGDEHGLSKRNQC